MLWNYGVVLDAGSSGTRVHIYKWLKSDKARKNHGSLHKLPEVSTDKKWTKKTHPGISTFGTHPHDVGPDHLDELFKHALKYVPKDEVANTPLFLLATAGMRILPDLQRKSVLEEVCAYARKSTKFQLPDCDLHVQVIPGETEGLYGWIAANYLLGGFDDPEEHDHGKNHHTYGFLDMGGASAQIAFAPNETEAERHANDLTLLRLRTLNGTPLEYKVFVTTWLGFGVNQARQRYVMQLLESSINAKEYPDPCLPTNAAIMVSDDGKVIESGSGKKGHKLVGTGVFTECLTKSFPLLEKEKECLDAPCLINGQHTPAIDFDVNHFVGVSEYYHTTHEIFKMAAKDDEEYDFKTYQKAVDEFCSKSWKDIEKGIKNKTWGKIDEQTAQEVCFKSSWLINVLHDGIGVPRVGLENLNNNVTKVKVGGKHGSKKGFINPFQAVNKINDVEVSWTLGKMVLYAASEVPPNTTDALAVGFGANVPGIPSNFQVPGGSHVPYMSQADSEWHDRLFSENSRRIPGFLIFTLIVVMICYFTCCGRERRHAARQKIGDMLGRGGSSDRQSGSLLHRRRRPFLDKLFGRGGNIQSYERVLEDGDTPNDFELGSFISDDEEHSDSSEGSARLGRTSGWATPQLKETGTPTFDPSRGDVVAQGSGLGLAPPGVFANAIDRDGLMSRTDSRERMARSRAGSPKRGKFGVLDA
ncbi:Golgi apyrase [Didymosphaeria variabile]|uniref:Golgi apyrase n=1 Tax=Didymosphaeria variabile TaxID=1932322 RepID=A0A9W8XI94_9PLEO|nr:Golgi apyrase [Didymosphaeria variabile]KAJ4351763.1 Golgi apyrase [Didymosphaeria variabile]